MKQLLIALLLIPALAIAASFDSLMSDTEIFEQYLGDEKMLGEGEAVERAYEEDPELFPGGSVSEVQEVRGTHVLITVDGLSLKLRDVPSSSWFAPFVQSIADRGIISGYRDSEGVPTGYFGPADDVTIEQIAKMAVESAGVDLAGCAGNTLNDTARGRWSMGYIACAESLGWSVYSDGSVNVLRPASRAEVVVTVLQAFNVPFQGRRGTVFEDVGLSTPFGSAVETAADAGVVSGYSDEAGNPTGLFGPMDNVNRAESAKMFSLAIQLFGE